MADFSEANNIARSTSFESEIAKVKFIRYYIARQKSSSFSLVNLIRPSKFKLGVGVVKLREEVKVGLIKLIL